MSKGDYYSEERLSKYGCIDGRGEQQVLPTTTHVLAIFGLDGKEDRYLHDT